MNARIVMSLWCLPSLATPQQGQVGAVVTQSHLYAASFGQMTNALPLGPVVAPVSANASTHGATASSSITPATATAPLQASLGLSAAIAGLVTSVVHGALAVDLLAASPVPGPQWLRVLFNGGSGGTGVHSWTLRSVPPGFQWTETRGNLPGYPLYLDIPVDLTGPAAFQLTWDGDAYAWMQCLQTCQYFSGGAGGTLSFLVRQVPPIQTEAYGAPCLTSASTLPIAVAYDSFGVSTQDTVDALLVCTEIPFRPVVLCVGASRDQFGPIRLPLDLAPFGAPGCALLQDMVLTVPATLSVASFASLPLGTRSQLRGLGAFYFQWLAVDAANPLGIVFSNGVKVEVP